MEIKRKELSISLLQKVSKISAHVVHVAVWKGGGLERCVDVNEFAFRVPSAKRDSAFGPLRCQHDLFQVLKVVCEVHRRGEAVFEMVLDGVAPAKGLVCERNALGPDGHGQSERVELPSFGCVHHQGGAPKLDGHVALESPPKDRQSLPYDPRRQS